jgi:hypothetical protein
LLLYPRQVRGYTWSMIGLPIVGILFIWIVSESIYHKKTGSHDPVFCLGNYIRINPGLIDIVSIISNRERGQTSH